MKKLNNSVVDPDNNETDAAELVTRLEALNHKLDDGTRQLMLILDWFKEFEDFTDWMRVHGFWDAEDIDQNNPMQTYKNGLIRFCKEHKIKTRKA